MRWLIYIALIATLLLYVSATPEANVACPDKFYESVCSFDKGCVEVSESSEVGSLFDIAKETGKISISMWLKVTVGGVGFVPLFDIVGRPVINGTTVNGDQIQLTWDSTEAQLHLLVRTGSIEKTITGLGIVPLATGRYRNLLITVDASTGVISVSVDSVSLISETFTDVKNNGLKFSPIASLGYGTTATFVSWTAYPDTTLADITVLKGTVINKFTAEHLSQFRISMKSTTNGCVVNNEADDPGIPLSDGNIHTFFFYKNDNNAGFSFNNSMVTDAESAIVESLFSLKPRDTTGSINLTSKSWTTVQEQSQSCGATQTAKFSYPVTSFNNAVFEMKFIFSVQPPTGTNFTLTNVDTGNSFGTFTAPFHLDTLWFRFASLSLNFKIETTGGFSSFCISDLKGYEIGSVLGDPYVTYYEQETTITLYTGIHNGYMGALLPANDSCSSPSADYEFFEFVSTTSTTTGYFTFTVKDKPPGRYILCLYPTEGPAQKHVAAECTDTDITATFFCSILLARTPGNAIELPSGWIRHMLHLGQSYYDVLPIGGINTDPFVSTGGESLQEPDFGDSLYLGGTRYPWSPLETQDGRFARNNETFIPHWIQYFAIAIYSPTIQSAVFTVRFNSTTRIYVDGNVVFSEPTFFPRIAQSSTFNLNEGWHQVLVKVVYSLIGFQTPEMSIRFDNAKSLSWNYVKPVGNNTDCSSGNHDVPCFGETHWTISHEACVTAGCCYSETNPINCFMPGTVRPYRADGLCGPGIPTESNDFEFAQCNLHSCCSNNYCGRSYANCTCTNCVDYNFVQKPRNEYILWGKRAMCSGSRDIQIGVFTKEVCQLRCNRDDNCIAFTIGTEGKDGYADCYLSYGVCIDTIENLKAQETYLRLNQDCGMSTPSNEVCTENSSSLTLYGDNMESKSCFYGCSMTAQCAVAIYNKTTKACMFSSTNCTGTTNEDSIMSRFKCQGNDATPPIPFPSDPPVPNATSLGCYKDPNKEYFARSQYNDYPLNLYNKNYLTVSNGDKSNCLKHCLEVGAYYFSITDGNVCTCGVYNNETLREQDQTLCNIPCTGEDSQHCGGTASASVYLIDTYIGVCQFGYSYFQGQCYKFVSDRMTWNESRIYCNNEGSTLASISNATANQYILSLTNNKPVWIGAHRMRLFSGPLFAWTDGSLFDFANWLPMEPDGGSATLAEDCVLASPSHPTPYEGSWMDSLCTESHSFVCKIDPLSGPSNVNLRVGSVDFGPFEYCLPKEKYSLQTGNYLDGNYLLHKEELKGMKFADKSDKGYDIELKGTTNPGWITGLKNQETLKFTGSFHIQGDKTFYFPLGIFSISAWINVGQSNMSNKVIISKTFSKTISSPSLLYEWALAFNSNGYLCFIIGVYSTCSIIPLPSGTWVHVLGVYDSATINLFLNGYRLSGDSASPFAFVRNTETFMVIGGEYREPASHENDFVGAIDDIRIYEAALGDSYAVYLSKCELSNSLGNIIPVYERSENVLRFSGGGFPTQGNIVFSQGECNAGDEVKSTMVPLTVYNTNEVEFIVPPNTIIGYDSQWILSICAVNQVNQKYIAGDLNFKVAVVSITSIMGVTSSTGFISFDDTTNFPLKVEITGHNLANNQLLSISQTSNCVHGTQLKIKNVNSDGTRGEITIEHSPGSSLQYICWLSGVNSNGVLTPYRILDTNNTLTAAVDGTKQISISLIQNGYHDNDNSFFLPCSTYDSLSDNFYITVQMGNYRDIFIPIRGETVCGLLTSTTTTTFTYSFLSPNSQFFAGHVFNVPSYNDLTGSMGGSPNGFHLANGRQRLSIWGNQLFSKYRGGCCQAQAEDIPTWGRGYTLMVTPEDGNKVWLDWEYPRAAIAEANLYFRLSLKNFRGEIQTGRHQFRISVGSEAPFNMVSNDNGVLEFLHTLPHSKEGDNLTFGVIINDNISPENGKNFSRVRDVGAAIPKPGILFDPTKPVTAMLRFGPEDEGIEPPRYVDAINTDWFMGNEAVIHPYEGLSTSARTGIAGTYTSTWRSVSADANGFFRVNVRNATLHYFSFAVYTGSMDLLTIEAEFNDQLQIYSDGQSIFSTANVAKESEVILPFGWHQIIVKAYATKANMDLRIRIRSSSLGWSLSLPTYLPSSTLQMVDGEPILRALRLGGENIYAYGIMDEDNIGDMSILKPHRGDSVDARLRWLPTQVTFGQWKVDGTGVSTGGYALRYLAFSLYALRAVTLTWTVHCNGPAYIWANGVVAFKCPGDNLPATKIWTQDLMIGWHQMIVKIGASTDKVWFFSMAPVGTMEMVGIGFEIGSTLPIGTIKLSSDQFITEMLLLRSFDGRDTILSEIPHNGNQNPSHVDFDITKPISMMDSVTLNIYGEKSVDFYWWPQVHAEGLFGSLTDYVAGNYNQYFFFALYSTGVEASINVSYNDAFSLFIDNEFVINYNGTSYASIPLNLSQGWHSVVFKLIATNDFQWINDTGTTTWSQAMANCQSSGFSQLCNYDAICPYELKRVGLQSFSDSTFAPFISGLDLEIGDYLQIHRDGGNNTRLCHSWSEEHNDVLPTWADNNTLIKERRGYACCGKNDAPRISVSISYTDGELGYSPYMPLNTLSPPTGKVDNPRSIIQTVTLSHQDQDVNIYYDFSLSFNNITKYTVPFEVTKTSTVVFWAFKDKLQSDVQQLNVQIPDVLTMYRTSCPRMLPCAIEVDGTARGKHLALVWEGLPLDPYEKYSTASEISRSSRATGILSVDEHFFMFIPVRGLETGTYVVFSYPFNDLGIHLSATITVEPIRISPNELIGHQDTNFQVEGLEPWDSVLFLEQWNIEEATCNTANCISLFRDFYWLSSFVIPGKAVTVDLHAFRGRLRCLCVSATGSSSSQSAGNSIIDLDFIGAVPVDINVVLPPTPVNDTVRFILPSQPRDGDEMVFGGFFYSLNAAEFNVLFVPTSENQTLRVPTCRITSINPSNITCSLSVSVGTNGNWTTEVYRNGQRVAYDGATNLFVCTPPDPFISAAFGDCASKSSSCINGALITLIGANFDHYHPTMNYLELIPTTNLQTKQSNLIGVNNNNNNPSAQAQNVPSCVTVGVTASSLTCQLQGTQFAVARSRFEVVFNLRLSLYTVRRYTTNSTLLLHAGSEPGWSGELAPAPPDDVTPASSSARTIVIIICSILAAIVLVLAGVFVFVRCRYNLVRRKEGEEEMSYMEEQLLRAEQESTASLKRTMLNAPIPPMKEGQPAAHSLNEL